MKKLYSAQNISLPAYLKTALEEQGIVCILRNEYLAGGAGELPPTDCWPELWLVDDERYAEARKLVTALLAAPEEHESHTCPDCGEHLEPQFSACWRCGRELSGSLG